MTIPKQFRGIPCIPKAKFTVGDEMELAGKTYVVIGCNIDYDWKLDNGIVEVVYMIKAKDEPFTITGTYDGTFEDILEDIKDDNTKTYSLDVVRKS